MPRKPPSPPSPASPLTEPTRQQASRLQMADIARLAGVSVSTVSRALSQSPLVNEATRLRVAELARSLNYSINIGAQNLRLKQNRTVAVVVPYDPATRQHLSDPFFLSLIGSIADALTDRGYEMLLSRVDADRLDLAAHSHDTGRAVGILMIGQWHHHDQLNAMAVRGVPFVVWGAQLPGQVYATVGSDNVLGGRLATAHLLAQGARQVVFMGDPMLPEVAQRFAGYQQALADAGLPVRPELCRPVPFVQAEIEQAAETLVRDGTRFDGLFAASDLMAMTAIGSFRRLGVNVPQDIKVVGYDDIQLSAHFHPSLSTVRQPVAQAGDRMVAALLAQLEGQRAMPVLLATELMARESSEAR